MWKRNGYWSTYPEDHLGRNEGIAMKNYENGYYRPAIMPGSTWAEDMQNYFLFGDNDQGNRGSNDFRSRKTNYYYAALTFDNGAILYAENKPKEKGTSDGTTASVRAQVLEDGAVRFNLNTLWLQKGNPNWHYTTPVTDISNGYVGDVELHMSDKVFSLICLHENKNHVEAKSATCTQPGTKEHWHCADCGQNSSDEGCQTVLDSVTIPAEAHSLNHVDRVEPTTEAEGNIEYWECTGCGRMFTDESGVNEVFNVTLPKLTPAPTPVIPVTPSEPAQNPFNPNAGSSVSNFPFGDVPSDSWYYSSVKAAWGNDLIDGVTANEFKPNATLTVAQTIKLAAALHQLDRTGEVSLKNGGANWYDSYQLRSHERHH